MSKKAVFYFMFALENEEPHAYGPEYDDDDDDDDDIRTLFYGFSISTKGVENYLTKMNGVYFDSTLSDDERFDEMFSKLEEEYGVHDWSSSPCDECYAVGYSTYETPSSRIPELMNKWRDFFNLITDNEASEVVQFLDKDEDDTNGSDYDYLVAIENKLNAKK